MKNFSGIVMAGGRSQRMGRDKALLTLSDGRTLLDRAIATLVELGAGEIILSVGSGRRYEKTGTTEVQDAVADCGPIAGLAAGLWKASAPLCLVLAVDMPEMRRDYLGRLLERSKENCGVVPVYGGSAEPLAAVYPRCCSEHMQSALQHGDYSLQQLVRQLAELGLVACLPVTEMEHKFFANWNTPADCR